MSTSNLMSLPTDISWRRLAFSPDMVDTNFDEINLPPKWRPSLVAFYYIVPEELTTDVYPDQKVVYLKISCSITGFNLSEELEDVINRQHIDNHGDDLQKSVWDALSGYWAEKYLPCHGAILQVAVFPHSSEKKVKIWEYPYIADFEPKKREMYETRTETGEVLSGSTDDINIKKGTTTTDSTEESDILTGVSVSGSALLASASTSVSGEWGTRKKSGKEETNVNQTNSSQQKRETLSASTTISQMYQLFNGYHLGTNRALFFILPRPHTVMEADTISPNLINGPRKLEGIQDVFLVVVLPKKYSGLCFQANLDTAHPESVIDGSRLLLTRRRIQSCGRFDNKGALILDDLDLTKMLWFKEFGTAPVISAYQKLENIPVFELIPSQLPITLRTRMVDQFNLFLLRDIRNAMLRGYTKRATSLQPLWKSDPIRQSITEFLKESDIKTSELVQRGYLSQSEVKRWSRLGIKKLADFFSSEYSANVEIQPVRHRILERIIAVFQPKAIGE